MKTIFLIALFVANFISLYAQIPEIVKKNFSRKYTGIPNPEFRKEDENLYSVHFEIQNNDHEALYDSQGNWLKTYIGIEKKELPINVQNTLKTFNGVEDFQKVETPKETYYECIVYKNGETYVAYINERGRILKKVKEKEAE